MQNLKPKHVQVGKMQFKATFIFWAKFENEQKIVKNALETNVSKKD